MNGQARRTLPEAEEVVSAFTKRVTQRFGDWITEVIFFGSRAKGRPSPGSDYDLLLVVRERDRNLIDQLYDEVVEFLLTNGVDLSLKIYTEKAFQTGLTIKNPFLCSVAEAGVELWTTRRKS